MLDIEQNMIDHVQLKVDKFCKQLFEAEHAMLLRLGE